MRKDSEEDFKLLITRYIDGIYNYLDFTLKSPLINNDNKSIHLGFRTITHIFNMNYIQTGDIDIAFLSMQKGYLYYLEYLEQIEENSMRDNLNHTNAILFVYSKALIKYSDDNRNNIIINNSVINKLKIIYKLTEALFWWDNPQIIQNRININLIKTLCNIIMHTDDTFVISYFEFTQRRNMNHIEYIDLIEYSIKLLKDLMKTQMPNEEEWKKNNITKINDIELNSKTLTIHKWCKWVIE